MIGGIGNGYIMQNIAGLYSSNGVGSTSTSGGQSHPSQNYPGPDYVNRIGEKNESDKSALNAYADAKKQHDAEKNKQGNAENEAAPEYNANIKDKASISSDAKAANNADLASADLASSVLANAVTANTDSTNAAKANADSANASPKDKAKTKSSTDLSEEEEKAVNELKQRDREVKAHEQQHVAASGGHAGSPSYTYERGPDNRQYAVGGSVSIDSSPVAGDPEATIKKAETIRKAALAPGEPSAQDKSVASNASAMAADARVELREAEKAERTEKADEAEGAKESGQAGQTGNAQQTGNANQAGNAQQAENAGYAATNNSSMQAQANDINGIGNKNNSEGYLSSSSMERKPRADAVAAVYQNMQNMNSVLGAIVPFGTAIHKVI